MYSWPSKLTLLLLLFVTSDLVIATVTEVTVIISWCTTYEVNIERAAVSHLDVSGHPTTV